MRVKICGITNLEDALNAIKSGADALGFVFYPKSPRYIEPFKAKEIIKKLPPFVEMVGLFVNESAKDIDMISKKANISLAQIHFEMDEDEFNSLKIRALRVVRAKSYEDVNKYSDEYRLVDAYCEAYGGEGKRLNLEWFDNIDCTNIIIAGGLDATNIAEIKKYNFYAVDVSSGVELNKGKKNSMKVKQFISNAKSI